MGKIISSPENPLDLIQPKIKGTRAVTPDGSSLKDPGMERQQVCPVPYTSQNGQCFWHSLTASLPRELPLHKQSLQYTWWHMYVHHDINCRKGCGGRTELSMPILHVWAWIWTATLILNLEVRIQFGFLPVNPLVKILCIDISETDNTNSCCHFCFC